MRLIELDIAVLAEQETPRGFASKINASQLRRQISIRQSIFQSGSNVLIDPKKVIGIVAAL